MAIVVEQEKGYGVGIVKILLWVIIVGVILAAIYYVFFKRPETIPDLITPSGFKDTTELSKINLNPETVIQHPVFQSLDASVPPLESAPAGRANPFLPF